jgi:hypothetical protein
MMISYFPFLPGLLAGTVGQSALAVNECRTITGISNDDGLTGGGARAEDDGPFVIDSGALRAVAEREGDQELADLLDRLGEVSERFLGHAAKQLEALADGKADEANKHHDEAMELSLPWHRLMKEIHELAKRKGYYRP